MEQGKLWKLGPQGTREMVLCSKCRKRMIYSTVLHWTHHDGTSMCAWGKPTKAGDLIAPYRLEDF